jgi:hypothetical protein
MNFLLRQKYLKWLYAGGKRCRWTFDVRTGQFIATGGRAGVKFTLPAGLSRELVVQKGRLVQEELLAVHADRKGTWGEKIDAKTHEIRPRETSKYLDSAKKLKDGEPDN